MTSPAESGPAGAHHGFGPLTEPGADAVARLVETDAVARLWRRDHTLWGPEPDEIADRLGWLDEPDRIDRAAITDFAAEAVAQGTTDVLWCGMGGSSLFPELVARVFPDAGGARLHVLDTSHPAAVARAVGALDPTRTLYCFASKSGGTVETRSQLDHCWATVGDPSRFVAVTDAGSGLDELARTRAWRAVFHANPHIGGRYSALSHFGLVPAALAGVDLDALLAPFGPAARAGRAALDADGANPAARLGALLAAGVRAGRDKCTLVLPAALAPFGAWVEQLVAESTGKHGTGVLPVVDEAFGPMGVYGPDRLFVAYDAGPTARAALDELARAGHPVVHLGPFDRDGLAAEVLRWELATALCGALLGINPFDQPDVESAKVAARAALEGRPVDIATVPLDQAIAAVHGPPDYVTIQAFVDPTPEHQATIERARHQLRDRLGVAVTAAVGPRYLHSTGQLHKGGARHAVCVQVVDEARPDLPIPGTDRTFGQLIHAQAAGDYLALQAAGQRVARVAFADLAQLAGPAGPTQPTGPAPQ